MNCASKEYITDLMSALRHGGGKLQTKFPELKTVIRDITHYLFDLKIGINQDDMYKAVEQLDLTRAKKMQLFMSVLEDLAAASTMGIWYIQGGAPKINKKCPIDSLHKCPCVKRHCEDVLEAHRVIFLGLLNKEPELIELVPERFRTSLKEQREELDKELTKLFNKEIKNG